MFKGKSLIVIICSALAIMITMGTRQSFGLFLPPMTADLGIGRETFSLAVAISNIMFGLPLVAIIADKIGAHWAVMAGGLFYGFGLYFLSWTTQPSGLYLNLGILVGLALSAASFTVVLGAVAQVVPPERRSQAFGLVTAAGSFGMFAVVPGAQWLLTNYGWQSSFRILAIFVGLIVLLSVGFPGKLKAEAQSNFNQADQSDSLMRTLSKARQHSGYWLLTAGFFVCGFHVAFIATHLPAFVTDQGISPAVAANALALVGLFNMVGSYLFGLLGDHYRKKILLSVLYFSRAAVISLFLIIPVTEMSTLIFGGVIGFLWLATVPLTSGLVAHIFGSRYLSTLYGFVFFSHQIGSFLGVWLGGRVYDLTGSYTQIWIAAVILGCFAGLVHLPITDTPVVLAKKQALSGTS